MSEVDRSLHEFFGRVLPDEDDCAFVDWVSGLIVLNAEESVFHRIKSSIASPGHSANSLTAVEFHLLEALTHEFVHCFQFALLGYPYQMVTRLMRIVENRLGSQPRPKTLSACVELICESDREEARQILDESCREVQGVCAQSLMEGVAYLTQKKTHYPLMDADDYRRFLLRVFGSGSPSAYCRAYQYADERLGDDLGLEASAFEVFPLLASVALCTSDPARFFVEMLDQSLILDWSPSDLYEPILERARGHDLWLGTASDVCRKHVNGHLFFDDAVARAEQLPWADVVELFAQPHKHSKKHVEELCAPLVFRRNDSTWTTWWFSGSTRGLSDELRSNKLDQLMVAAVITSELFGSQRGPASPPFLDRMRRPSRKEIAEEAYWEWVRRGRRHGYDVDDWLGAERRLGVR